KTGHPRTPPPRRKDRRSTMQIVPQRGFTVAPSPSSAPWPGPVGQDALAASPRQRAGAPGAAAQRAEAAPPVEQDAAAPAAAASPRGAPRERAAEEERPPGASRPTSPEADRSSSSRDGSPSSAEGRPRRSRASLASGRKA